RAALKVLDHLDVHCRNFIALSPFLVLSTASAQGQTDASPRGDPPGFVAAPDEHTLLIPDRPGNNQIDSLRNLAEHSHVGLLFFVPGMNETLRVKGTAEIVTDAAVLELLAVGGKAPLSALRVTVEEAFLHCGRALIRSRLWDPAVRIERSAFPTYGQVLADQIAGANARDIDAGEDEANRTRLY
ncbi:MAG: pyridoxamine 5'-phosphate oxidase family protein, partial [Candidatus Tectomicrobia bacterium]|nr:pyridoxamine 5'-phosphate oxidase family protein [Candidatus Tectomicrobia bacterium]